MRAQSMKEVGGELTLTSPGHHPDMTRLIQLTRINTSQSYGFAISKGQQPGSTPYISEIDADSPASQSNLRLGDLVLKFNGIDLTNKSYTKILEIGKKQTDKGTRIELEIVESNKMKSGGGGTLQPAKPRTTSHSDMLQEDFQGNNQRV